jgi:acetoin utilization protein AcuC
MADRAALIYGEAYQAYRFGAGHPFDPLRLRLTLDLMADCQLLDAPHHLLPPRRATDAEIATVHSPAFIEAVRAASDGTLTPGMGARFGLGTDDVPIFPGMHDAAATIVGGSLLAADLVMHGDVAHAFNIGGGLHHAMRSLAAGFCVYNDAAIACQHLVSRYGARVLYIDNDAHHGDGVQEIFYDSPEVLTLSLHETGRYLFPGTGMVHERGRGAGHGYAVNVPLDAFTDDASWIDGFARLVPAIARAFRPDVIVIQNGCDGHFFDPLTDLHATTRTVEHAITMTHALAHELCGGRLIALGGGGYDIWRVVPRAWTLVWAALSDQAVPDAVPQGWLDRWQPLAPVPLPHTMRDAPDICTPISRVREVTANNAATYDLVWTTSLPLLKRD